VTGSVQSSESAGHYGIVQSYGPTSDMEREDALRIARTGTLVKQVDASSSYLGPGGSLGAYYEEMMFLNFDTSFLLGAYPTSFEFEVEFGNDVSNWVDPIETQFRLVNWAPPLVTDYWLTPAEFSAAPLVASITREYLGDNHAAGTRVTVSVTDPTVCRAFNPTGMTGLAIAYGVFARDTYQTTWSNEIEWLGVPRPTLNVLATERLVADQPSWGRPGRTNSIFGILDAGLGPLDTELSSSALAYLGDVSSGFVRVTLDPGRVVGDPEVVHIVAHTAGASTATIRRAAEATIPRAHPAGVAWEHAPTAADYRLATLTDVRPDTYIDSAKKTLVENPSWQPLVADSPRYVSGPGVVYADVPPTDVRPGTIFISRSGDYFDYQGKKL